MYTIYEAKKNGFSGVPSVKELIDDAVRIHEMYNVLQLTAYDNYMLCRKA